MGADINEIGRNIRKYRKAAGLNQAQLAERVNVTSQHISHVENGYTSPSLGLLVDISNVLKTDMNSLFGNNLKYYRTEILRNELAALIEGADESKIAGCIELCRTYIDLL